MSYDTLYQAFPYMVEVELPDAQKMVAALIDWPDTRFPNGTSFAVTSNAHQAHSRILWLSHWSYRILNELEYL